ncbi:hypothetical protein TNCV_1488121 [Trichonephila clavipes]|nr:hypothetical protein TNCV_1488121 [Trichonephila clavipes]
MLTIEQFEANNSPELEKRRGTVFHQDNTRPHSSIMTHQTLQELNWEVPTYAPYNPELTQSNCQVFSHCKPFLAIKCGTQRRLIVNFHSFSPTGTTTQNREHTTQNNQNITQNNQHTTQNRQHNIEWTAQHRMDSTT